MPESSDQRGLMSRLHVDPTISIGHILTTVTLVLGLFIWGANIDKRIESNTLNIRHLQDQYARGIALRDRELERVYQKLDSMDEKIDFILEGRRSRSNPGGWSSGPPQANDS